MDNPVNQSKLKTNTGSRCLCLSLYLSQSVCLCLSFCLYFFLCLSVCMAVLVILSVRLSLSVCLSLSFCLSVCLSLSFCLSVCLSLSVRLFSSFCLSVSVADSRLQSRIYTFRVTHLPRYLREASEIGVPAKFKYSKDVHPMATLLITSSQMRKKNKLQS